QGNIPQSDKFNPKLLWQSLNTYMNLAALAPKAADGVPAIIVMPETVLPVFQDQVPAEVWQQWIAVARLRNASLVMGVPLHAGAGDENRYTNSAIVVTPDSSVRDIMAGTLAMHYDKHHLVPFGEFVPTGFRWFINELNIPLGDFNRGPERQRLFDLDGQRLAPDICYENAFGEEIIRSVRDSPLYGPGATILVNISNLGWFGNTWALRQSLEMSRMRALETARPMLMATNTGITAAISPLGAIRDQLPPMSPGVLDVEVQGYDGYTPYVRWGDTPVLAWTAILLLLGLVVLRRRATATRDAPEDSTQDR
ncbi:MAG: apolipoprotein N-acyltransferase, partial [Candidimonas sp.]